MFTVGAKAYPKSARMLTALGAALFAGAFYDEAALRLCDASDLNPANPEPYMFMGKIEMAAPNPLRVRGAETCAICRVAAGRIRWPTTTTP